MKIVLFAMNGSYSHTCLAVYCLRGALERAGFAPKIICATAGNRCCRSFIPKEPKSTAFRVIYGISKK